MLVDTIALWRMGMGGLWSKTGKYGPDVSILAGPLSKAVCNIFTYFFDSKTGKVKQRTATVTMKINKLNLHWQLIRS
jgi:hypothetical protein